ncbi:MAG: carbohydrate porin [Zoogloea sp.]|nr:carbohydrate porin [Zoogloea sp.]
MTAFSLPAAAGTTVEERLQLLESRLNSLERENSSLKNQLATAEQKASSAERKVDAAGEQLDRLASQTKAAAAWAENTTFGGYGELHLNKLDNQKPGGADTDKLDFHRFVLFMGHKFSDRIRFFSELEVEHALSTKDGPGEVELEQAYLDFLVSDNVSVRGGLFLMPVGIINETHEPPTFYGVERNPVESQILPSTWWEGGVMASARLGSGFTLDGAITSGLKTTAAKNYAVRSGRQKVANAQAEDAAYTARLKWTAVPGVELAGTVHRQSDITQSADATAGGAWLYETHAVVNRGPFGLKALYARWDLDGDGPKAAGADRQRGWYVEPSFRLNEQWGLFARYNRWDNQAGDSIDSDYKQVDVGVNFWPHPDVVVKVDYQNQKAPNGKDELDGFNVGLGYQF